ncbi:MAG: hypothetical protein P8012_08625 [Desulfobacterales bacterium]
MDIIDAYDSAEAIATGCLLNIISSDKLPKGWLSFGVGNELKPSDLYCYLQAKYGSPNGLQNLLRNDSSDNLIHWEWVLICENGLIFFQGMNLRTEINFLGEWKIKKSDIANLVDHIKSEFSKFGKEMSQIRKNDLEDWDLFANPYQQLKSSISQLSSDLSSLKLNPSEEKIDNPTDSATLKRLETDWSNLMVRYNRGIGLAMSLSIMTPILAESFVNFIIFILCRPDIKNNKRLFESFVRSNIDVRIQSLHINCIGFDRPVDWQSEACREYNSIINKRNDMLHGNISPDKLKMGEIYFKGNIPIFKKYQTLWQHSIGASLDSSGFFAVNKELDAVNKFVEYVLSCLNKKYRESIEFMSERRDLGLNKENGRIGVLLPDSIADFGINF